jgi:hypothetical protein
MDSLGIIYYSKAWDMQDEKTGERRQGVSVEYLAVKNLAPVVNDDGSKGVRHTKESIPLDKLDKLEKVPGVYKLDFGMKPGSRGKMEVKLVDVTYVGDVK